MVLARPGLLLRLEGLALFVAALALYAHLGGGWVLAVVLFLSPDLAALGYLLGPRIGAACYNLVHTDVLPVALGLAGLFGALGGLPVATTLALIWLMHIGFDRLFGYGLKYPTAFKDTHLGRV